MATGEKSHEHDEQSYTSAYVRSKDLAGDWNPSTEDRGVDEKGAEALDPQIELEHLEHRDDKLKIWIRVLKFASRTMGVLLSFATVIPLAMMTKKYLETRGVYFNVNGTSRTAWPSDVETVFNNVYLSFAIISLVLNIIILLAYFQGIDRANSVARIHAIWTWIILGLHVVVMITGVAVYQSGSAQKSPNGEHRDLWGWACSPAAEHIQPWVKDMKYSKWCAVQTTSYYVGIANVAGAVLTITIWIFALLRKRTKKKVDIVPREQAFDGKEPINSSFVEYKPSLRHMIPVSET